MFRLPRCHLYSGIAMLVMIASIYGLIATIKYFFLDTLPSVGVVIIGSCLCGTLIITLVGSITGLVYCIRYLEQADRESEEPDSFVIAMNRRIINREKETLLTV